MATVSPLQVVAQHENGISDSDLELIRLIGLPNKIIIQRVGMIGFSEKAISMRLTRIAVKLGVENRTAIVIKALSLGIVTIDQLRYRKFNGNETNLS